MQRKKSEKLKHKTKKDKQGWLVFFYSVPSKPVGYRVKIWRKLSKAGAIQFKGSVYVLPDNEMNHEFFSWLVNEVVSMSGEAAFLRGEKFETSKERELINLFNQQRAREYRSIEKKIHEIESIINNYKKGTNTQKRLTLPDRYSKLLRNFEEVERIDFFKSKAGSELRERIEPMENEIRNITTAGKQHTATIKVQNKKDYHGKIWVTRKNPFVDRIASAWLIKEFIDKKAVFIFIDEDEIESLQKGEITFDIGGGDFTHVADMCSFEVLLKSFRIKDKVLKKISEIVHQIDLRDDKFLKPESKGIEDVIAGIRKTGKKDQEILEKGMEIFRMLYASKI